MKNIRSLSVLTLLFASLFSFFVSSHVFASAYNPNDYIPLAWQARAFSFVPQFILENTDLYTLHRIRLPFRAVGDERMFLDSLEIQFEDQRSLSIYPDQRQFLSNYQRDAGRAYIFLVSEDLNAEHLAHRIYPDRIRPEPCYEDGYIEFAIYYPVHFEGLRVVPHYVRSVPLRVVKEFMSNVLLDLLNFNPKVL